MGTRAQTEPKKYRGEDESSSAAETKNRDPLKEKRKELTQNLDKILEEIDALLDEAQTTDEKTRLILIQADEPREILGSREGQENFIPQIFLCDGRKIPLQRLLKF